MRRFLLLLLLFILLLFLPSAVRYLTFYEPGAAAPRPDATYDPGDIPALVPTPAFTNVDFLPSQSQGRVLLDIGHDNDFTLDELSFLDGQLAARGYELSSFSGEDLGRALRPVSAYVVITPLKPFTDDEVREVARFVTRGGRLLLVGDPARFATEVGEDDLGFASSVVLTDDQLPLNSLANAFGLIFGGDYLYNTLVNEGNFRNIIVRREALSRAEFTSGLEQVVFYGAHSVRVAGDGAALFAADANTWSSATDRPGGLAMGALAGNGRVLALGDLNLLLEPYATAYDNSRVVERLVTFLTEASRELVLEDFPYFFERPVDLVYAGAPDLGPDAFDEIIALQAAFRSVDQELSLAAAPAPGHDALYLGLYNQAEDVADLLEAAGIAVIIDPPLNDDAADAADAAGDLGSEESAAPDDALRLLQSDLGSVQLSGTALLLLAERDDARSLVVLAASGDGLENTVDRLLRLVPSQAPDVLADCLLADQPEDGGLALCPTDVAQEAVEARLDSSGAPDEAAAAPEEQPGDDETAPPGDVFDPADVGAVLQGTVALDETVSGMLAPAEEHAWHFAGGPLAVDIRVETDDANVDLVLAVLDAAGETVAEADNGFSGDDEWLLGLEVPADTTYTILVRDYYSEGGPYRLTVTEAQPAEGILIFADDDGVPTGSGATGVADFRELIGPDRSVTVWQTTIDGPLTVETLLRHEIIIWTSGDFRTEAAADDPDTNVLLNYLFLNEDARLLISGATPALFEPAETGELADVVVAEGDSPLLADLPPGERFALTAPIDAVVLAEDAVGPDDVVLLTRGPDSASPGRPVALGNEETAGGVRIVLLAAPLAALPTPLRTVLFDNALQWLSE